MLRYVSVLLLLSPLVATAQQSTFGVLGGATLSGYTSSEIFRNTTTPLVGALLGVYRGISLTESLDIEPGLYFSQKGIRYRDASSSTVGRNRLSYLVLPLVVRKRLVNNFSVHIGPYVAGFIYGSYRYSDATRSEEWDTWGISDGDRNIPDAQLDLGFNAGLRYVLPSQFVINASYERGGVRYLRRVISDGPYHQTVTVSVGYQW